MKVTDADRARQTKSRANAALISGAFLLVVWAYVTITTVAPGWFHVLLTAGVFLLIYGVAARDQPGPKTGA